jgi:hypothetical protein
LLLRGEAAVARLTERLFLIGLVTDRLRLQCDIGARAWGLRWLQRLTGEDCVYTVCLVEVIALEAPLGTHEDLLLIFGRLIEEHSVEVARDRCPRGLDDWRQCPRQVVRVLRAETEPLLDLAAHDLEGLRESVHFLG